jgi:hypothetical protein
MDDTVKLLNQRFHRDDSDKAQGRTDMLAAAVTSVSSFVPRGTDLCRTGAPWADPAHARR